MALAVVIVTVLVGFFTSTAAASVCTSDSLFSELSQYAPAYCTGLVSFYNDPGCAAGTGSSSSPTGYAGYGGYEHSNVFSACSCLVNGSVATPTGSFYYKATASGSLSGQPPTTISAKYWYNSTSAAPDSISVTSPAQPLGTEPGSQHATDATTSEPGSTSISPQSQSTTEAAAGRTDSGGSGPGPVVQITTNSRGSETSTTGLGSQSSADSGTGPQLGTITVKITSSVVQTQPGAQSTSLNASSIATKAGPSGSGLGSQNLTETATFLATGPGTGTGPQFGTITVEITRSVVQTESGAQPTSSNASSTATRAGATGSGLGSQNVTETATLLATGSGTGTGPQFGTITIEITKTGVETGVGTQPTASSNATGTGSGLGFQNSTRLATSPETELGTRTVPQVGVITVEITETALKTLSSAQTTNQTASPVATGTRLGDRNATGIATALTGSGTGAGPRFGTITIEITRSVAITGPASESTAPAMATGSRSGFGFQNTTRTATLLETESGTGTGPQFGVVTIEITDTSVKTGLGAQTTSSIVSSVSTRAGGSQNATGTVTALTRSSVSTIQASKGAIETEIITISGIASATGLGSRNTTIGTELSGSFVGTGVQSAFTISGQSGSGPGLSTEIVIGKATITSTILGSSAVAPSAFTTIIGLTTILISGAGSATGQDLQNATGTATGNSGVAVRFTTITFSTVIGISGSNTGFATPAITGTASGTAAAGSSSTGPIYLNSTRVVATTATVIEISSVGAESGVLGTASFGQPGRGGSVTAPGTGQSATSSSALQTESVGPATGPASADTTANPSSTSLPVGLFTIVNTITSTTGIGLSSGASGQLPSTSTGRYSNASSSSSLGPYRYSLTAVSPTGSSAPSSVSSPSSIASSSSSNATISSTRSTANASPTLSTLLQGVTIAGSIGAGGCARASSPTQLALLNNPNATGVDVIGLFMSQNDTEPDQLVLMQIEAARGSVQGLILDVAAKNDSLFLADEAGNTVTLDRTGLHFANWDCSVRVEVTVPALCTQLAALTGDGCSTDQRRRRSRSLLTRRDDSDGNDGTFDVLVALQGQCGLPVDSGFDPDVAVGSSPCTRLAVEPDGAFRYRCSYPGQNTGLATCRRNVLAMADYLNYGSFDGCCVVLQVLLQTLDTILGPHLDAATFLAALGNPTGDAASILHRYVDQFLALYAAFVDLVAAPAGSQNSVQQSLNSYPPERLSHDVCDAPHAPDWLQPLLLAVGSTSTTLATLAALPADALAFNQTVRDANQPACCPNPQTCAAVGNATVLRGYPAGSGVNGTDCLCGRTTEGGGIAFRSLACSAYTTAEKSLANCTSSAQCPDTTVCLVGSCCGFSICVEAMDCFAQDAVAKRALDIVDWPFSSGGMQGLGRPRARTIRSRHLGRRNER